MGYLHQLNVDLRVKVGTSMAELVSALAPLFEYFGHEGFDTLAKGRASEMPDHLFQYSPETGDLHIYTNGEVCFDFKDLVDQCAENLGPLLQEVGTLHLENHTTAELDDAVSTVVAGPTAEAIREFEFNATLGQAVALLEPFMTAPDLDRVRANARAGFAAQQAAPNSLRSPGV